MKTVRFVMMGLTCLACLTTWHGHAPATARAGDAATTYRQIAEEVSRTNEKAIGWPLPVASHWCGGSWEVARGFRPQTQLELIDQGHHLLPWLSQPGDPTTPVDKMDAYVASFEYEKIMRELARRRLPFSFISTQWEHVLSEPPYLQLPADRNPNVVDVDGKIQPKVSPLGPVDLWREAGQKWTDNPWLKRLQELYPDPPRVVFVSNNEHATLHWSDLEQSSRYMALHGPSHDDVFKRTVASVGWMERYRALQAGMRMGLTQAAWRQNSLFIAYTGAFGMRHMGRWGGWRYYSLTTPQWLDPGPMMWDGGEFSYYNDHWSPATDFRMWSPQIEEMNDVVCKAEALKLNPDFWIEQAVWDGHEEVKDAPPIKGDKREYYKSLGQTYTPERYGGWVRFGMWLTRPRCVREYRGHLSDWEACKPYFMALVGAVDELYDNATLQAFWRQGRLVPNRAHEHPYQIDLPESVKQEDRWFLLDADVNQKQYPWESFWEVPVYALAMEQGRAPKRSWLIYAHSPLQDRKDVTLTLPEYGPVKVDVPVAGTFYLVSEAEKAVTPVKRGS
ncbi:MAG: hypothetical protein IT440_08100 [Phycisphaeraceae bacterium]|nr:hypothetical protein [Phycisphaeraceae bacterium]